LSTKENGNERVWEGKKTAWPLSHFLKKKNNYQGESEVEAGKEGGRTWHSYSLERSCTKGKPETKN